MTIDLRATAYCSLGPVISGNVSDSYLQGSGLVKTTGQVVLNGQFSPAIGQTVQFAYYQKGILSRIPRSLRVLSFFADPFRNQTTVELGDVLTYLDNRKPPEENPTSTTENPTIPCEVLNQATIPISAQYVFSQALSKLGISSSFGGLTNYFSVEEFDMSSGYVDVIDKLLVSECYFGYIDESEQLVVRNLNDSSGGGPLISQSEIIDVSGINSGELPGDGVVVKYSSLKLKKPDELASEEATAEQNWEYEKKVEKNSDVEISTQENLFIHKYKFPNCTTTETRHTYDSWNRRIKSVSDITKTIIVANPAFIQSVFSFNLVSVYGGELTTSFIRSLRTGLSSIVVKEREIKTFVYTTTAVGPVSGCQYQNASSTTQDLGAIKKETTELYQTEMGVCAAMNIPSYLYGAIGSQTNPVTRYTPNYIAPTYLTKKTVVEYENIPINIKDKKVNGKIQPVQSESTKTVTTEYVASCFTKEGQQAYATMAENTLAYSADQDQMDLPDRMFFLINSGRNLVVENIRTEMYYGANFGMQIRPSRTEINNAKNSKDDPTESVAQMEWITGSADSASVVTFDMPYAPDDRIGWTSAGGYTSTPSDAASKAHNYGNVQNKLLYGNRYGVNIQISPNVMPPRPFDPIYINARGIMGQYRVNAASWVFDSTGIVSSVDALFWGAVGGS